MHRSLVGPLGGTLAETWSFHRISSREIVPTGWILPFCSLQTRFRAPLPVAFVSVFLPRNASMFLLGWVRFLMKLALSELAVGLRGGARLGEENHRSKEKTEHKGGSMASILKFFNADKKEAPSSRSFQGHWSESVPARRDAKSTQLHPCSPPQHASLGFSFRTSLSSPLVSQPLLLAGGAALLIVMPKDLLECVLEAEVFPRWLEGVDGWCQDHT